MIGLVDEKGRALLEIPIRSCPDAPRFRSPSGSIPRSTVISFFSKILIGDLGLEALVETEAILANGSKVVLETFLCFFDWFGTPAPLQVIANDGSFPLLGVGLLNDRVLHIDDAAGSLSLI